MAKTASQIVDRALLLIDEVPTTFATAASTETSIRDMALAILPEVCRDLVKELPWELKKYLATSPSSLPISTLSTGELQNDFIKKMIAFDLPSDYWELVSIKMTIWSKSVTKYIYVDDPEYQVQHNPFTRAGKRNPVVAINTGSTGTAKRIECYSYKSGDSPILDHFQYVSFNNIPDNAGTTWPDQLFDEITKALATELNIIKARIEEAVIRSENTSEAIEQHK